VLGQVLGQVKNCGIIIIGFIMFAYPVLAKVSESGPYFKTPVLRFVFLDTSPYVELGPYTLSSVPMC
jgi:hypothetical protein